MEISNLPTYYYQAGLSGIVILLFFNGNYFIKKFVRKRASMHNLERTRIFHTPRFLNFVWLVFILALLFIIWDISIAGLSIYFASIFTVIGVGFFAQWSILSNITAGVLLFFN